MGSEKALTMVVGEQRGAQAGPMAIYVQAPCPPGVDCEAPLVRGRVAASAPMAPRPPAPAVASWSMSFDGSLAGAVLQPIDEDLEELLGTATGAFVLRVAPGTPAADAGLRSGDVVVQCEGEAVASPRDVRRVFQRVTEKGGRALALVSRARRRTMSAPRPRPAVSRPRSGAPHRVSRHGAPGHSQRRRTDSGRRVPTGPGGTA
jgi:membrane-associated protease RseP (regulator of RpoE activity)